MNCIKPEEGCIGCTACYSVCPVDAINMGENADGFYTPFVNRDICIDCEKCKKVCPLIDNVPLRTKDMTYSKYMFAKNEERRKKSCSGGVFYALALKILMENGVVCGCIWDEEFKAKHICTQNILEVKKMRGSKYVQSDLGECFKEIKTYIKSGKTVLFSGTGCQTSALKKYIGKEGNNLLICCAVICGGVPSPKVWKYYCSALEKQNDSRILNLEMRSKKNGWLMPEIYVEFSSGYSVQEVLLQENLYGTNFGQGLFINDECMECKFKLDSVDADILLSDDWGINKNRLKKSKNKGSSAVVALTQVGSSLLRKISDEMIDEMANIDDIIASHHVLTQNHIEHTGRNQFFQNLTEDNILELLKFYFKEWEKRVSMNSIVKLLYKLKIYTLVYNIMWKFKNK